MLIRHPPYVPLIPSRKARHHTHGEDRLVQIRFRVLQGGLTGDSLAPQQLEVYNLSKQLPNDISNDFDPEGYYNPSDLVGSKNYTVTNRNLSSDSLFNIANKSSYKTIGMSVPLEHGKRLLKAYKDTPETFQWPQTFAQYFPGLYVESSFGKGLIANLAGINFNIYYHNLEKTTQVEDGDTTTVMKPSLLSKRHGPDHGSRGLEQQQYLI